MIPPTIPAGTAPQPSTQTPISPPISAPAAAPAFAPIQAPAIPPAAPAVATCAFFPYVQPSSDIPFAIFAPLIKYPNGPVTFPILEPYSAQEIVFTYWLP